MYRKVSLNSPNSERGTYMLFFVAAVLPTVIFLMALFIDITNYFRRNQHLQEVADDAAMLAWRYLPYQHQAIEAVNRFLMQQGLDAVNSDIRLIDNRNDSEIYNDEFEVTIEERLDLTFMSYFDQDVTLPIRVIARTRSTPRDVYIAVDRSSYVAPRSPYEIWGSASYSPYFLNSAPFSSFIDPETSLRVSEPPAVFMTQLCFNSYFSEIKQIAIMLYEYFSGIGRNGIGIGVFPGIDIESLRNVRGVLRPGQNVDPLLHGSGEAYPLQNASSRNNQDYYSYKGVRLGASSWCAAAASQDFNFISNIPYEDKIDKIWKPPSGISHDETKITKQDFDDVIFNPDYQASLSVREVIWSAVAKNSTPNSRAVFERVIANLAETPDSELISGAAVRGGLVGTSVRTGIILAGDVPYYKGTRFNHNRDIVAAEFSQLFQSLGDILSQNQNLRFKLIYVVIDNPYKETTSDIKDRAIKLSEFFENEKNLMNLNGRLDLQVIYSEDLKFLREQLLAAIVLENKHRVISY